MVGVRTLRNGRYQVFVKVRGQFRSKCFPKTTALAVLKAWREEQRVRARLGAELPPPPGETFKDDVRTYLASVTSMPSYADRCRDMQAWASVFGTRSRHTITPLEIRTQLERWRRKLSASTCNKRRTALMSFYTALNGRSGENPVKDVSKYHEDESPPRAQSFSTIYRILACMRPSQTRARLRVILWTGWPHAQLKRLRPEHLDLPHARAYVTPRRKGKGRAGRWLPLLPGAVMALQDFVKWDSFTPTVKGKPRPFSHSAMHAAFQRALEKFNRHRARFGHPPITMRPYDLRHSAITWLAERITDERALQEFALHSRPEQTRRYSEAATAGRLERAMQMVREAGLVAQTAKAVAS